MLIIISVRIHLATPSRLAAPSSAISYRTKSAPADERVSFQELRFQWEQFHTGSVVAAPEIKLRRASRLIE